MGFSPGSCIGKAGARRQHRGRDFGATTGPDGVALFDWLPANNESLTFWPNSEGFAHRRVELKEVDNGPITATLTRKGRSGSCRFAGRIARTGLRGGAIGSGQGSDNGQGRGSRRPTVLRNGCEPREGYAVYVDDENWAAPSGLHVVVRDSKPVGGVDFKLMPGTIIRGTVTVGPGNRPAAKQFIRWTKPEGPRRQTCARRETVAREIRRQFGGQPTPRATTRSESVPALTR